MGHKTRSKKKNMSCKSRPSFAFTDSYGLLLRWISEINRQNAGNVPSGVSVYFKPAS